VIAQEARNDYSARGWARRTRDAYGERSPVPGGHTGSGSWTQRRSHRLRCGFDVVGRTAGASSEACQGATVGDAPASRLMSR